LVSEIMRRPWDAEILRCPTQHGQPCLASFHLRPTSMGWVPRFGPSTGVLWHWAV